MNSGAAYKKRLRCGRQVRRVYDPTSRNGLPSGKDVFGGGHRAGVGKE